MLLPQDPGDGKKPQPSRQNGQRAFLAAAKQPTDMGALRQQRRDAWYKQAGEAIPFAESPSGVDPGMEWLRVGLDIADDPERDLEGYLTRGVPEVHRKEVSAAIGAYQTWMEKGESYPLSTFTRTRENLESLKHHLKRPGGREDIEFAAKLHREQGVLDTVSALESAEAQARAAFGVQAVASGAEAMTANQLLPIARGFREGLGEGRRLIESRFNHETYYRWAEDDMSDPGEFRLYQEPTRSIERAVLRLAEEKGLPVGEMLGKPLTAPEARESLDRSIALLEQMSSDIQSDVAVDTEIASQLAVMGAARSFLTIAGEYARNNPDEEVELGEVMETTIAYMQGDEIREDELGGVPALLVGAFRIIATADSVLAELTTAAQPKIRPVALVFQDGTTSTDFFATLQKMEELRAQGAIPAQSPRMRLESESNRAGRLRESAGKALANFAIGDAFVRAAQSTVYGWGAAIDLAFGGLGDADKPGAEYAYPVPIFDKVTDTKDWGERFGNALTAITDGPTEFILDNLYDQANSGIAGTHWGRRWTSWIMAAGFEFAASPWNAVGTGKVVAADAATAQREILEVAGEQSARVRGLLDELGEVPGGFWNKARPGPTFKARRAVRFSDGREMNANWMGAHDALARLFGRGKKYDFGAADDVATVILTAIRDNPNKTTMEVISLLKNDQKYLRQLTSYLPDTAMPGVFRMGASQDDVVRMVQRTWDGVESDVTHIVDAAGMRMGPKWANAADKEKMMEQARGLFVGGIGVPMNRVNRRIEAANEKIRKIADSPVDEFGEKAAVKRMDQKMARVYTEVGDFFRKSRMLLKSGFSMDAASTGLAAKGGVVPEVREVPYRMRKMIREQYRRRLAAVESSAQNLVHDVFTYRDGLGKVQIYSENDRKLVSLLVDLDPDINVAMRKLLDMADDPDAMRMLAEEGVAIPKTADQARRMREWLAAPTQKLQAHYDEMGEEMVRRGLTRSDEMVDDYLPYIYRNVTPAEMGGTELTGKALAAAEGAARRAESRVNQAKGTHARVRHGPIDLLEAIKGNFQPELDAAAVLYSRTLQFGEIEAKSVVAEKLAAEFGVPMVTRRETLGLMLQEANHGAWEAQKKIYDNAQEAVRYNKSLGKVAGAIRDSDFRYKRRAILGISRKLGIKMGAMRDHDALVQAVAESDEFLKMAGSRSKNSLDKLFPPSLREVLRAEARPVRAARLRAERAKASLDEIGLDVQESSKLAMADEGELSRFVAEYRESLGDLRIRRERQAGLRRTVQGVKIELRESNAALKKTEKASAKVTKQKERAGLAWTRAKEALEQSGANPNRVGFAQLDEAPEGVNEKLFAEYKKRQRAYVELAQVERESLDFVRDARMAAEQSRKRLSRAEHALSMADGNVKKKLAQGRETKKAITVEKGAARRRATEAEKRALAYLEAKAALKEAESRLSFLLDGPVMQQTSRVLRDEMSNLVAANRLIKSRITSHSLRYGLPEHIVRARALRPKTARGAVAKARQKEARGVKGIGPGQTTRVPGSVHGGIGPEEALGYMEVDELFKGLGWQQRDVAALLWETFRAHHITEVPLHELRALVSANGGMMAKVGRFIWDPIDDIGSRGVYRSIPNSGPGREAANRVASALSVNIDGRSGATRLFEALDDLWARGAAGDEAAQKLMEKLSPADLRQIFKIGDLGEAVRQMGKAEIRPKTESIMARMVSNRDSPLAAGLEKTLMPLEIGLMHKQLIGEGIVEGQDILATAWVSRLLRGIANHTGWMEGANRAFKTGVTVGRGSFAFGRRNAWFDGAKSMFHLGLHGAINPKVRSAFNEDMLSRSGFIDTPNGPVAREVFHQHLDRQGYAMFSQRLDQAEMLGEGGAGKLRRMRHNEELERNAKLRSSGTGLDLEKQQKVGVGVGAAAGALGAGDPLLGAAIGYQGGTLAHSFRNTVAHTGGSMPSKLDFLFPLGAAANERLENWYRSFAYWSFVKSGMGPQEAMNRMLGMMRDYSNMTPLGQNILRRLPVLFYNFTHQNVIAMAKRMENSPARALFFPRLVNALTGEDEGSEDYQTVFSALKLGGTAYYLSDELDAAISVFDPLYQAMRGNVSGVSEGLSQQMAPAIPTLLELFRDGKDFNRPIPPAIARSLYEKWGPIDTAGIVVQQNSAGGVTGTAKLPVAFLAAVFGTDITANDVGNLEDAMDRREIHRGILSYFFGVKTYDLDNFMEGRGELLQGSVKKVYDNLEGMKYDDRARSLIFENPYLFSQIESDALREFTRANNGEYLLGLIREWRDRVKASRGESDKLVPRVPSGREDFERIER